MQIRPTEKEELICMTAEKSSDGPMAGMVILTNSWNRLRMPSMAPASYRLRSTPCSPAMKARKLVPRGSHSCTTMTIPKS